MRRLWLLMIFFTFAASAQQHCGYDFTSYIVLHVHEDGKKDNIPNLTITLVDSSGNDVINTSNKFSWKNKDEILQFTRNFQIDASGNPLASPDPKAKWYFPFAKDTYLLSVTNDFPADNMSVKIVDPNGQYLTEVTQLYAYNMYILCTTQVQQQAVQFGPRVNKPVNIVLRKP